MSLGPTINMKFKAFLPENWSSPLTKEIHFSLRKVKFSLNVSSSLVTDLGSEFKNLMIVGRDSEESNVNAGMSVFVCMRVKNLMQLTVLLD